MPVKSVLLTALVSCLFLSCNFGSNKITLESNSVPLTFKLDGSEKVQWIWIKGPYQNTREPAPQLPQPDDPKKIIIWKISAAGGKFLSMNEIPPITYGQLPDGWRQDAPESGSPPPLLDGYVYHVDVVLVRDGAPPLCVYVKGGQIQRYVGEHPNSTCK